MHPRMTYAIYEWSAGLLIGLIPLLCHLVISWTTNAGHAAPGAWTVDILLVAITTSGLSTVTLFTRLARGTVLYTHIKPHSMFMMALNMVAFLLSGVLFGQVSSRASGDVGLMVPILFLILATASSLYFEILIAIETISDQADAAPTADEGR